MNTTTQFQTRLEELRDARFVAARDFEDVTAAGDDSEAAWQKLQTLDAEITRTQASLAAAQRHEEAATDRKTRDAREKAEAKAKAAHEHAMQAALKFEEAMERAAVLHGEVLAAFEEAHRLQIGNTPAGSTLGAPAVIARIEGRFRQTVARQQRRGPNGKPMPGGPSIESLASFLGVKRSGGFLSRFGL
ncbi:MULTISPECIES: hypothetical protein [unclassified Methylibium]|uniref:hypothetical protein n=1 Tax=unclassified Methylibium TaxID=2633235 RepID=UPI0003F43182|nr:MULTISPECIES: hypothetical protein [unclassified Methylibium]EWS53401.1 hypothetical protein X551_03802 [Methylibium sp. T29]EWS58586.1 hypothetical protein Y694_03553 [Methylibium sp. T29-B]